jgi:hypothetical protein
VLPTPGDESKVTSDATATAPSKQAASKKLSTVSELKQPAAKKKLSYAAALRGALKKQQQQLAQPIAALLHAASGATLLATTH